MAAGLGFKTFTTGEVLTAADTNGYLMQGVLVFASSAARAAAITSPQEGQYSYLKDTNSTEYYDGAAWIAAPIGDITGVTAGTGISGGGTSGTVTVTNSMATAIDAKGDLIAGTGADAFSRIGVGANNTVLTADSAEATGLKWAAPAAASFVGCSLYATAQNISNSTLTNIAYANEFFDSDGFHDNATNNSRITIPSGKAGKYLLTTTIQFDTTSNMAQQILQNGVAIGGTSYGYMSLLNASVGRNHIQSTAIVNATVGDYFESVVTQSSGSTKSLEASRFDCTYLGA